MFCHCRDQFCSTQLVKLHIQTNSCNLLRRIILRKHKEGRIDDQYFFVVCYDSIRCFLIVRHRHSTRSYHSLDCTENMTLPQTSFWPLQVSIGSGQNFDPPQKHCNDSPVMKSYTNLVKNMIITLHIIVIISSSVRFEK